jgi:hypothetical protein
MVLLGTRPRGGTPAFHVLGRETFHTTVQWIDGWPVPASLSDSSDGLGAPAAPTVSPSPSPSPPLASIRDDFADARLAPGWISVRRSPALMADLTAAPGRLQLRGTGNTLDSSLPVFVARRQQHPYSRVRALMDSSHGCGGLAIRIDERHHYEIEAGAGRIRCTARVGPFTQEFGTMELAIPGVVLRIETVPTRDGFGSPGSPPDLIRLGIERSPVGASTDAPEDEGEFVVLGELDGRYLSTEVAGGFTGRVIGMFSYTGMVAFDWFEYQDCGS